MPMADQGIVSNTGTIKNIHDVLYVLGIRTNLFSVGKLIDIGYRVFFESKQFMIKISLQRSSYIGFMILVTIYIE